MHEVLVNRLGGLSLPRKSVVRLTDRPDMTLDVYRGRKTTKQQQSNNISSRKQTQFIVNETKTNQFCFGVLKISFLGMTFQALTAGFLLVMPCLVSSFMSIKVYINSAAPLSPPTPLPMFPPPFLQKERNFLTS